LSAVAITIFVSVVLPRWVPPQTSSIVRDWVPYLFLFLFYSQGGQFVTGADRELETRLARLDRSIVAPPIEWCAGNPGVWILTYLELVPGVLPGVAHVARCALSLGQAGLRRPSSGRWFCWPRTDLVEPFRSSRYGLRACSERSGVPGCRRDACEPSICGSSSVAAFRPTRFPVRTWPSQAPALSACCGWAHCGREWSFCGSP
jgi:hypothetical protein